MHHNGPLPQVLVLVLPKAAKRPDWMVRPDFQTLKILDDDGHVLIYLVTC